jgi:heme exporter protein D
MSKGKKKIVRLTESEMVNLIERIVETVKSKKETLKESKRKETRRRVMAEANRPKKRALPRRR